MPSLNEQVANTEISKRLHILNHTQIQMDDKLKKEACIMPIFDTENLQKAGVTL